MRLVHREKKVEYHAIVVGSGASGGWACKRLAEAGLKVALLEAGKPQSDRNFSELKPWFELKYRNRSAEMISMMRPMQSGFKICNEYTSDLLVFAFDVTYT